MLQKHTLIAAKLESVYRTDIVPSPTDDACRVEDISWSFADVRRGQRARVSSFGMLSDIRAGELVEVSFKVPLQGSGSAGVAGDANPILEMAGLDPAIVGSTSVTYSMIESGISSGSLYIWEDGKLIKLVGCRATLTGALALGDSYGKVEITVKGHLKENQTDVPYPSFTFDAVEPPALNNMTGLLIGAFAPDIGNISFDLGLELSVPDSVRHSDGYGEITIVDNNVTGSFDPLDTLVATNDWMAAFRAGTSYSFTTGVIGTVAGNRYEISATALNFRELSPGERSKLKSNTIGFHCPDGITIAFT